MATNIVCRNRVVLYNIHLSKFNGDQYCMSQLCSLVIKILFMKVEIIKSHRFISQSI
jgi:hypothetical protein